MTALQHINLEFEGISGIIEKYTQEVQVRNYLNNLKQAIAAGENDTIRYCLKSLLSWYDDEMDIISMNPVKAGYDIHMGNRNTIKCLLDELTQEPQTPTPMNVRKVFIVHGHDDAAKYEMARTLEKAGLETIILHEKADSSCTIIEKIEKYSDVDYAVILYTECDLGRAKEDPIEKEQHRARQNVVFEHGYLMGKLGRERVSALVKGNVETPGDISGVVYIPMDTKGGWKMRLARNMIDAGLPFDTNSLL